VPIPRPTPDELRATADDVGLTLSSEDLAFFGAVIDRGLRAYDLIDELPGDGEPAFSARSGS
jgi:hypothetical protein